MVYYRLYFMDGSGGHVERFEEFDAEDDEEAIRKATGHRGLLAMELWCRRRKVKSWAAGVRPGDQES